MTRMARPPKITVEMCEEKIADLEDENEQLRARLAEYEELETHIMLDVHESMDLAQTLQALTSYVRAHICPAHLAQVLEMISHSSQVMQWFAVEATRCFTPEELHEAQSTVEVENIAEDLGDEPVGGVFN